MNSVLTERLALRRFTPADAANLLSLNGDPLAWVSKGERLDVSPSGVATIHISVNGARGNTEIRQMVREGVAAGIASYDAQMPARHRSHVARYE